MVLYSLSHIPQKERERNPTWTGHSIYCHKFSILNHVYGLCLPQSIRSPLMSHSHDDPGVVLHDGVVQVESPEVHDGRALRRWDSRWGTHQHTGSRVTSLCHTQRNNEEHTPLQIWAWQAWRRCRSPASSSHSVWTGRPPHAAQGTWTHSPRPNTHI